MTNEEQEDLNESLIEALWAHQPIEEIKAIIEAGADVLAKDKYGCTVIDNEKRSDLILEGIRPNEEDTWQNSEQIELLQAAVEKANIRQHIEAHKKHILKSRETRKEIEKREGKVSGVALADEIARDIISGKEKRTITPEIGAEIRRRKAAQK